MSDYKKQKKVKAGFAFAIQKFLKRMTT